MHFICSASLIFYDSIVQLGSKLVLQCRDILLGLQLWEHVEAPWAGASHRGRLASTRCGPTASRESNWLDYFLSTPGLNYQIQLVIWLITHTGCFIPFFKT